MLGPLVFRVLAVTASLVTLTVQQDLAEVGSVVVIAAGLLLVDLVALVVLLSRVKRASSLKTWAQAIAKRSGAGKARVALARKLSVILHSIWRSGEPFRWSEQEQPQAA